MKLPNVRGVNLLRQKVELPADLRGELNLLFIPFYQWQQMEVNTWVPLMQEIEQTQLGFAYYELPTIQRRNKLAQTLINEGMRAGIPDPVTRERTITLYLEKQEFLAALGMRDQDHIYIVLTDRLGNILWQARGQYTPEIGASLQQALQEFRPLAETA